MSLLDGVPPYRGLQNSAVALLALPLLFYSYVLKFFIGRTTRVFTLFIPYLVRLGT